MAMRILKPLVRWGGYYPSKKYTPLVYPGGYTTMDAAIGPLDPLNTFSGDIVRFTTKRGLPMKSLKVSLSPQQDLHGYDSPWPAGGGKNKFNPAEAQNNKWLNVTTGAIENANGFWVTGFIPVKTGDVIRCTFKGSARSAWYNSDKSEATYFGWSGGEGYAATSIYDGFVILAVQASAVAFGGDFIVTINDRDITFAPYENICPISGYAGATVYDDSKYGGLINWNQLNDYTKYGNNTSNGVTFTNENDGRITLSGTATGTAFKNLSQLAVTPNHVFWIRGCPASGSPSTFFCKEGFNTTPVDDGGGAVLRVTREYLIYQIFVYSGVNTDGVVITPQIYDITEMFGGEKAEEILAMGSSSASEYLASLFPKDYYPYNAGEETTVSAVNGDPNREVFVTFGETVYGGTVDVVSGVLTIDKAIVDLGTETWSRALSNGHYRFYLYQYHTLPGSKTSGGYDPTPICSNYPSNFAPIGPNGVDDCFGVYNGVVLARDDSYETVEDFTSAMSGVDLVYPLATPITIQLTPQQVTALKGYNAVWSDAGPVEVTAYGTPIVEPNVPTRQALNLLLGGAYRNDQTEDDVSDEEALDILLGGADR